MLNIRQTFPLQWYSNIQIVIICMYMFIFEYLHKDIIYNKFCCTYCTKWESRDFHMRSIPISKPFPQWLTDSLMLPSGCRVIEIRKHPGSSSLVLSYKFYNYLVVKILRIYRSLRSCLSCFSSVAIPCFSLTYMFARQSRNMGPYCHVFWTQFCIYWNILCYIFFLGFERLMTINEEPTLGFSRIQILR